MQHLLQCLQFSVPFLTKPKFKIITTKFAIFQLNCMPLFFPLIIHFAAFELNIKFKRKEILNVFLNLRTSPVQVLLKIKYYF